MIHRIEIIRPASLSAKLMFWLGMRWNAAFTNAMCDSAWGKFPTQLRTRVSYSSDSRPTSLLIRNSFLNSFSASGFLPANASTCTSQKLHARNAPCCEAFSVGSIALQQTAGHQVFLHGCDRPQDALIGRWQEPNQGQQQQRSIHFLATIICHKAV